MTFCANCGQDVEENDNYCEKCGFPLKKPIADGVNDDELPLGIIAGFQILAGKNKIFEIADKFSMVIYPDVLVFAKYNSEWDNEARKNMPKQGFWARINNSMKLDEVYANTYRTWPAYKVLAQDPDNFSYSFNELDEIIIDAHDGSMRTGVDFPGGVSVRAGSGGHAIIDYQFTMVIDGKGKRYDTNYYPREIEMLRKALPAKLRELVQIIGGLPDNPFEALAEAMKRKLK